MKPHPIFHVPRSSCTAMNGWHINLKNWMLCKIGEKAKDACTSFPDVIRYFEKLKMVVNPVVTLTRCVVAAIVAETLLGCTILVDPALPNVLRSGRIIRRNMFFEPKPMVNIGSEMSSFKVRNELSRVGEVLVAYWTDNPYGDWIVAHLFDDIPLRKTVIQRVAQEVFLEVVGFGSREPAFAFLQITFPGHGERTQYFEEIIARSQIWRLVDVDVVVASMKA